VADRALGEPGGIVFTEDNPLAPLPERQLRAAVERIVIEAADRGIRSLVIRPGLIYGRGRGLNPQSFQLPLLARVARQRGRPAHVGRGLNVWSHVHIDDVADLYARALAEAPPGSVFFCESGESSWRDMAAGVGRALGLAEDPEPLSLEDSLRAFGIGAVTSFGSNSRVSAEKARRMLGWNPSAPTIWDALGTETF
jgi:nucleoside-diphosphate-sugar epimerase